MQTVEISQSPRVKEFLQNPFDFYTKIRLSGPLVKWQDLGLMVTADYSIVNKILRDRNFVREPPNGFYCQVPKKMFPFYENESNSMLEREPPTHTRLKSAALADFSKANLKRFEPKIKEICYKTLTQIKKGQFDLTQEFSRKFPVLVISRLLGVPEEMAPQLVKWSNSMVAMYQSRRTKKIEDTALKATVDFSKYARKLIEIRRKTKGDDVISHLLLSDLKGEKLSEKELVSTIILLLNAGHEATVHTISNGVKALIESGCNNQVILKCSKRVVEEILRFSTPLHLFRRYSAKERIIGDHTIKKGEEIGLLLAAGNRDPKHFVLPEIFDPLIKRKPNLSLGAGVHFCLGAQLARLELEIAIKGIFELFPSIRITDQPEYADTYHFHSLKRLTVEI